jgi:PST family polysaccharide transporter
MPGFAAGLRENGMGHAGVAFLRVTGLAILLAVPMGTGTSLVSGPFVALAIGERWAEAAPLMAVIALLLVPTAPGLIAGALLTARAQLRTLFAISAIAALLRVGLAVAVTRHLGLMGIALGMGLLMTAENIALVVVACRSGQIPLSRVLGTLWRPLGAAGAMVVALQVAGLAWAPLPSGPLAGAEALAMTSLLGAAVFASALAGLWWLSRRPQGAETDALLMARRSLAGIRAKLSRRGG